MTDKGNLRPEYSLAEEIVNSISHGIGAALSIAAVVILLFYSANYKDTWRVVSFSVYGSTLFILYLASTLYHAFTNPAVKRFFRIIDHSSIFLLIAGTYTPVCLVAMRGAWGWTLFGLIWTIAVFGIIYETVFLDKHKYLSLALYTVMGWLAVIAIKPMIELLPTGLLVWIFIGGLFYTLGIIFYAWDRLPYNHATWHVFVLCGSISHFFGILFYLPFMVK